MTMLSPSNKDKKKKRELPPLFWFMELGDWEKASERIRRHPREVKVWATLKTKSSDSSSSTKRLALHHACFKLRSAGSAMPPTQRSSDDPFVQACRFILMLIRLYPDAASQRESRHGCLPLHLAAFASCSPRTPAEEQADSKEEEPQKRNKLFVIPSQRSVAANTTPPTSTTSKSSTTTGPVKPPTISLRAPSDASVQTNMSMIHAEETYTGGMGDKEIRRNNNQDPNVSVAMKADILIPPKREEMAVQVINALLDAYPKGIRVDSEGGRLPLHTAVAGRATPRVISTLVTAYPAAARHRNKDGFLPLHLAAHWGVSHPNVAITLLKAYPDATLGRNRWERTPLEEALTMAGENGRPHQGALVRALRKHPNYWANPPPEVLGLGRRRGVAPVDIDESLPSNEDSTESERRYLQYGQQAMVDPDDEADRNGMKRTDTPPNDPNRGGFLSRLTPKKVPSDQTPSPTNEDERLAMGFSLETLIQNRRWSTVVARLDANPLEAEKELAVLTRGGFAASSGMTPLHYVCERNPPVEVVNSLIKHNPSAVIIRTMPGGSLPLHVACTWYGSGDVVGALLAADETTARVTDELGNLALHSACFSGAGEEVLTRLLRANPKAVLTRNKQGSRPIDICKRLRHENRRVAMSLLILKQEELMSKHKRSHSSGTWSEVASQAADMNERQNFPPQSENGFRETDDLQEQTEGVEVTYTEDEEDNQELLWI